MLGQLIHHPDEEVILPLYIYIYISVKNISYYYTSLEFQRFRLASIFK